MNEFMYDINSALIALALLATMVVAVEAGYRLGLRRHANADAKAHINTIQASILGVLALLLGFTFQLSMQRYDTRGDAVVDEANAIGTAWLRTDIIPAALQQDTKALFRSYVAIRVRAGEVSIADRAALDALATEATRAQNALWVQAKKALEAEPNAATSGLFVQAVNDMFDQQAKRDATLIRHVPELVLLLLYVTFLMAGSIIGLSAGVAGHRPSFASYVLVMLIVVLVFIILDLDRPRRGLILVDHGPLTSLQQSMGK
ncbi:MAG: hypothetical protein WCO67_07095 [Betaproteobacteria bacterium]